MAQDTKLQRTRADDGGDVGRGDGACVTSRSLRGARNEEQAQGSGPTPPHLCRTLAESLTYWLRPPPRWLPCFSCEPERGVEWQCARRCLTCSASQSDCVLARRGGAGSGRFSYPGTMAVGRGSTCAYACERLGGGGLQVSASASGASSQWLYWPWAWRGVPVHSMRLLDATPSPSSSTLSAFDPARRHGVGGD